MVYFGFQWWDPFGIKRRYMYKFRKYMVGKIREDCANLVGSDYMDLSTHALVLYDSYDNDFENRFYRCYENILPLGYLDKRMISEHQIQVFTHNLLAAYEHTIFNNPYFVADWVEKNYHLCVEPMTGGRYGICLKQDMDA